MLQIQSSWDRKQTNNFDFYFLIEAGFVDEEMGKFIEAKEKACEQISEFLQIRIKPKIRCYVFPEERELCKKYFWLEPNQALPGLLMLFSRINQSPGHELVHVFSYYLNNAYHSSYKILSEGLAVYLDQTGTNYHLKARDLMAAGDLVPLERIVDVNDFNAEKEEVTYPQCASFVGFLIEMYGLEKFKKVWVGQDLKGKINEVYGQSLNDLETKWLDFLMQV